MFTEYRGYQFIQQVSATGMLQRSLHGWIYDALQNSIDFPYVQALIVFNKQ